MTLKRGFNSQEAMAYLGVRRKAFEKHFKPYLNGTRFGTAIVYDRVDLDAWLDQYKQRGRAGKEVEWPVKPGSTDAANPATGGLQQRYRTPSAYAKALGLKTEEKPKPSSHN